MKEFEYIKIQQNDEMFLSTKMTASYLIDKVDFHFRTPYVDENLSDESVYEYMKKLKKQTGQDITASEAGIQRRTDLNRIEGISRFILSSKELVFVTPIILAANIYDDEENNMIEINAINRTFTIRDDAKLTIIDGQHRLLGLASAIKKNASLSLDIPVMVIQGANLELATKLFIDINSNQRKVNKSIIYDLYSNLNDKDYKTVGILSRVVHALNEQKDSPLKGKIKQLGIGSGTVSQSFMIDNIKRNMGSPLLDNASDRDFDVPKAENDLYGLLYRYFYIVAKIFKDDWEDKGRSADNSMLVKTNGIGALLMIYPELKERYGDLAGSNMQKYISFFNIAKENGFEWNSISGSGIQAQKELSKLLIKAGIKES